MPMDTSRVYDGFTVITGGVDGGRDSSLTAQDQCAFARNLTFRDSFARTRPPFANILFTADSTTSSRFSGKFQGAMFYESESGNSGIIVSRGGKLFQLTISNTGNSLTEITPKLILATTAVFTVPALNGSVTVSITSEQPLSINDHVLIDSGEYAISARGTNQITVTYLGGAANATVMSGTALTDTSANVLFQYLTNDPNAEFIHLFQAENYGIILGNQHSTVIYDGSMSRTAGVNELPPSFVGKYAWGRIWLARPDLRTFIAGDIVYGPSGTAPNGFRDAILKVTENDFLNEGGAFGVPNNAGPITCITALATQDTSLGIGPILVGTTNSVVSVNAPVDRTTWKNLTYPIQTISLIDYGPMGPRYTASVNGDWFFRSLNEIRSFIVARRDINVWGNTPMSQEVDDVLTTDSKDLLFFGSNILFDNKLFTTVSPHRTTNGVQHSGMVVLNFDPVSSMRGKAPPAWEGVYTGLEVCQFVKGRLDGVERAFMVVMNGTNMEFWEVLVDDGNSYYDEFIHSANSVQSITRTPIKSILETRRFAFGDGSQLKKLYTAELFLDDIVDAITLVIRYRPDQYPVWINWATISLCANVTQCTVNAPGAFSCQVWQERQKQYAARIMLPSPAEGSNQISPLPLPLGYEFQFKFKGTGHFRIRRFKVHCKLQSDRMEGSCPTIPVCQTFPACDESWLGFDSHLG